MVGKERWRRGEDDEGDGRKSNEREKDVRWSHEMTDTSHEGGAPRLTTPPGLPHSLTILIKLIPHVPATHTNPGRKKNGFGNCDTCMS